jgi:hypothetical protein
VIHNLDLTNKKDFPDDIIGLLDVTEMKGLIKVETDP